MVAVLTAPALSAAGDFQRLTGADAEKLFKQLQELEYPNDGLGRSRWEFTCLANGTWDGAITAGSSYDAYGTWRVENDEICVVVRGGDLRFQSPYEGCFAVLVNPSEGIVAGKFPDQAEPIVMKEDVADEIAELVQPLPSPKVVAQATKSQAAQG